MPDDVFRLIYGFDPLCGWCYGLIPAMRRLREAHPDIDVELVCGGLVTGARVGPYRQMAGYVRAASAQMTAVTGQALSEDFFALIEGPDAPERSNSAVPSSAILAVRMRGDDALGYAHALQEAHFGDGLDLNAPGTHRRVAARLGIEPPPLDGLGSVDETEPAVAAEFARARALGIDRFPTLLAPGADGASMVPGAGELRAGRARRRGRGRPRSRPQGVGGSAAFPPPRPHAPSR